jgi:hypothetical protein
MAELYLSAADELHDLDFRSRIDRRGGPAIALHNRPIEFYRDPFGFEMECPDHVVKGGPGRKSAPRAIDCNLIFF